MTKLPEQRGYASTERAAKLLMEQMANVRRRRVRERTPRV
jgi:hypothetical protein